MKLLTNQQINKESKNKKADLLYEYKELSKLLVKKKIELERFKIEMEKEKDTITNNLLLISKKLNKDKKELEADIINLKVKKYRLLQPIVTEISELNYTRDDINKLIKVNEEIEISSMKALDDLSAIKNKVDIIKNENKQSLNILKNENDKLIKDKDDFKNEQTKCEKDKQKSQNILEKRNKEICKREERIYAFDAVLKNDKLILDKDRKVIESERKHLYSQQQSLRVAFQEAKKII